MTVLIFSSYDEIWKPAYLAKSNGKQKEMTCFKPQDKTEAYYACSVNWKNSLFVYGGHIDTKKQISRLSGPKLKRVGDLPFKLYRGSCSVMAGVLFEVAFSLSLEILKISNTIIVSI